jgi:hypothetical protein
MTGEVLSKPDLGAASFDCPDAIPLPDAVPLPGRRRANREARQASESARAELGAGTGGDE